MGKDISYSNRVMEYMTAINGIIRKHFEEACPQGVLFLGADGKRNLKFLYEKASKRHRTVWIENPPVELDFWRNFLEGIGNSPNYNDMMLDSLNPYTTSEHATTRALEELARNIKSRGCAYHVLVPDFEKMLFALDKGIEARNRFSAQLKGLKKQSEKLRIHASANKHMEIQKYHRSSNFTFEYGSTLAPKSGRFAEEHPCGFSEGDFVIVENLPFPLQK